MSGVVVGVVGVLVAALGCGVAGLLLPRVVAALPEPEPVPEEEKSVHERREAPKVPWVDLAAAPGLGARLALACAVVGGLLTAVVAATSYPAWLLVGLLPLGVVGTLLTWVDARTRLLPRVVVVPTTLVAVVLGALSWPLLGDPQPFLRGLVGLVALLVVFFVLWFVYPPGLGFGDVRLAGLLGFVLTFLGLPVLLVALVATYAGFSALGLALVAVALVRRDRDRLRVAYPFGPFLLVGALVGVCVTPWLGGLAPLGG